MKDKITVLIPTYNRADTFLPDAIKSVLAQTYRNFELIIGDNASTDNTAEVVKKFSDKRIKYVRADKNTGTPYTFLNKGIDMAEGKWICFLDDDSRYNPEHVGKLLEKTSEGYEVVYCYALNIFIDENFKALKSFMRGQPFNINNYILGTAHLNFVDTSDIMASKKAILDVGGFREDASYQDYAIMVKLGIRYKVGWVEDYLTEHIIHKWTSDFSPEGDMDFERKFNIF